MITKGHFSTENRRNCSLSELYGGGLFIKFNSYSFNFNGGLRKHRVGYCLLRTPGQIGKKFLRFLTTDLLRFHRICLLFDWSKLLIFALLRINLPNLCPNMNNFDSVDFSECHSGEVISFFWRSVYFDCVHYLITLLNRMFSVCIIYIICMTIWHHGTMAQTCVIHRTQIIITDNLFVMQVSFSNCYEQARRKQFWIGEGGGGHGPKGAHDFLFL